MTGMLMATPIPQGVTVVAVPSAPPPHPPVMAPPPLGKNGGGRYYSGPAAGSHHHHQQQQTAYQQHYFGGDPLAVPPKGFVDIAAANTRNNVCDGDGRQHQQAVNGHSNHMMGHNPTTANNIGGVAPSPPAGQYYGPAFPPYTGQFPAHSQAATSKGGASAFLTMGGSGGIHSGGAPRMQIPVSQAGGNCPLHRPHSGTPHMLYWDASHPTGISLPLRQPNPPVYFNLPAEDKEQTMAVAGGSPLMSGTQSPISEMTVSSSDMSGEETGGSRDNSHDDQLASQLAFMSLNQNYIQQQQQQYIQQGGGYHPHSPSLHMGTNCHPLSSNGHPMQLSNGHPLHMSNGQQHPMGSNGHTMQMSHGHQQMAPVQQIHIEGAASPHTFLAMNGSPIQQQQQQMQTASQLSPNAPYGSNLKQNGGNGHCGGGQEDAQQPTTHLVQMAGNALNNDRSQAVNKMSSQNRGSLSSPPNCYQPVAAAPYVNGQTSVVGITGQLPNTIQV